MQLVLDIYKLVSDFPSNEKYSLTSQITRSAISIPSNIAEGASRNSEKDFAPFLEISLGSVFELETQVRISFGLKYISENKLDGIIDKCISLQKRIYSLRKKIINN
jgi:four helix bundle protein